MLLLTLISFLIIGILTLRYWIEFATDFVTNLSVKKVIGALLVAGAVWLAGAGQSSGDINKFIIITCISLLIGGIGVTIIYFDMAKDKIYGKGHFSEVDTLTKALEQKDREEYKISSWNMDKDNEKDKN